MFDVIVIGAGVMGSAAAYYAAAGGASVLLLEQYRFLHRRGSSHGESRITRLTYPTDTVRRRSPMGAGVSLCHVRFPTAVHITDEPSPRELARARARGR